MYNKYRRNFRKFKKNINDIKKSKGLNPIIFNKIKIEENDMEIIRSCKRQIFQEIRNNKKNNQWIANYIFVYNYLR